MSITGVSTQLMLGQTEAETFNRQEIVRKLSRANELVDIKKLFFWNAGAEENFDFIADLCGKLDIDLYCWFPVLADIMAEPVSFAESTLSVSGDSGYGPSGKWDKIESGEENFRFSCPVKKEAQDRNFKSYREVLKRGGFKGVFLDRIRYPSFANGLEAVFSCLCPDCLEEYFREMRKAGRAPGAESDLPKKMRSLYNFFCTAGVRELAAIESWSDLIDRFDLVNFIEFRYDRIDKTVGVFADYAKSQGLDVGLDLLTTSLGPIVGQDYALLQKHCSWLKMMTYCYANGPAGVPLEIASLARGIMRLNETGLSEEAALHFAGRIFNLDLGGTIDSLLSGGVNSSYLIDEVKRAEAILSGNERKIMPGIELVNHPFFTPPVSPEQCRHYLDVLEGLENDIIACWNILYIPEEYLSMIKERIK